MRVARVLVVEDYEPWRCFLVSALQKYPQLEIVGEVSDAAEALRKCQELRPDLILLDVGLPGMNGIDAARRLKEVLPDSKILFVSQESSDDVMSEAMSTGAQGYVVKTNTKDLLAAVSAALAA